MIERIGRLSPADRAALIHRTALNDVQRRLWRAALGDGGAQPVPDGDGHAQCRAGQPVDLDSLVAMVTGRAEPQPVSAEPVAEAAGCASAGQKAGGLGPNQGYAPALAAAARRTGLPETALAAIVNAEAAKDRSGRWNPYSRNPRSSAAGLGQFLSGTWRDMAQRDGSWLNARAKSQGWLDSAGRVRPSAQAALLQLRYDPAASIETTADYARMNLGHLARKGVRTGNDSASVARTAYLAHHLGPGDAVRYLNGGLGDARAATLLHAQIGSGRARKAIAGAGDASAAHRAWLDAYVARNVRPDRFAAST